MKKKQTKWLDNFGKADNANESNVSLSENFNGLAYDTSYRDYSPAWGGQFQQGGTLPGSVGFTYARTAGSAPSEGPYAKKTMPSAQNGIIADKIAGAELRKSKEYQDRKYLESLPQLRQAPSREEELLRTGLRYADVATDVMQAGNFIPHPAAQTIGKIGNAAGSLVDLTQAGLDFYSGDVGSGSINLASAALPSIIKNPDVLGGYKRSAKYAFGNRSTYLPIDKQYGRMTEKQLLGNRALFGALGAETVYDSSNPKFQNGGEMKFYQEGLDWKPKSISRDGSIIKDNQGYWNPDNWGKPVEIDSNDITMRGVYEPLLGISDMGDVQYMTPGNDYKFKGSKVTEFPVAQTGKNVDKATFASAFPYVARKTMQFMGVPLPVRTLSADLIGATDTIDESDLNEEELKALQAIVRKNLAKGKTTIEYPDYETSESPYSDVSSVGFSKIMDKLDDPNYRLKTTIGQANILTTNGDTLVVDKYDFNDKGKRNVEQLIDNIKKRDAYQTLRTVGSIWGSGPEDESSKIEIKTSNNNERDWINSGPQFGRYAGMSVFNKKKNGGTVGINDLDAQPMKKLNQLLNFTNNPDKTNWLDKYQ